MKYRVRVATALRTDVRAQLAWLARVDEDGWIEGLRDGIDEAIALLVEHPRVGSLEAKSGRAELRRLVLRRVPYVAWCAVGGSAGDVWLLRLFHARQQRPSPSWPAEPARGRPRRPARRRA